MSIDGSNMSQSAPVDKTIDTTAANETAEIEMPVGNQNQILHQMKPSIQ